MTRQEVIAKLKQLLDESEQIINTREHRTIGVDEFLDMYANCELTYESLSKNAKEGWQDIFDEWKEKGILN